MLLVGLAAVLDSLMGRDRDKLAPSDEQSSFRDDDVSLFLQQPLHISPSPPSLSPLCRHNIFLTVSLPVHSLLFAQVCKHYLVDFCPCDLFPNTKSDLGPYDRTDSC